MMLYIRCFILLFTCLPLFSAAQTEISAPKVEEEIMDTRSPFTLTFETTESPSLPEKVNALLWRISGNGLEKNSYLYGTIHMIPKEDFFLTDATMKAFNESEVVTFEIDMDDMTGLGAQLSMLTKAFMKNGQSLKKLLSAEDYTMVSDHFKQMGLPMGLLDKVKPMFLSMMADPAMLEQAKGDDKKMSSYEMEFYDIAKKSKKPVEGLETVAFQMGLFDQIPYEDQAAMLVESIKALDAPSNQMDEMVTLYKNQDIEGMVSMMGDDEQLSSMEDMLLNQRNANWIAPMTKMMQTKTTFFAVGAGHLGGDKGVIQLLRNEGYTLEPQF